MSKTTKAFGRGVQLAADIAQSANPRWIQIAFAGVFRGYRSGTVVFDRALFDKVIANFRAHPSYGQGPDGVGNSLVVHFDYEHASEMDPRVGSIPIQGTPAPAWVMDLEVRNGPEGEAQLWALAKLGQTVLAQITADPPEYQWTSVAIDTDAVDPISGAHVGPL